MITQLAKINTSVYIEFTKICTRGRSSQDHSQSLRYDPHVLLLFGRVSLAPKVEYKRHA
jgi:hypothetical protein